jgi:hypothetical protein
MATFTVRGVDPPQTIAGQKPAKDGHNYRPGVHRSWVHEMTRLYKLGVHTFYRPRAWGSGDYEPVWGTPPNT